jgi:solute carrier family 5 (sodium/myo-inositol cotransporter), member 3
MTGVCTITGGLAAVIYTETIQSIIMIFGGLTLMGFAFKEIGGYEQLYVKYYNAIPTSLINQLSTTTSSLNRSSLNEQSISNALLKCGLPNKNAFQMLRGITDHDMPWLGFLIGQTPSSIWYWCSDQVIILVDYM